MEVSLSGDGTVVPSPESKLPEDHCKSKSSGVPSPESKFSSVPLLESKTSVSSVIIITDD